MGYRDEVTALREKNTQLEQRIHELEAELDDQQQQLLRAKANIDKLEHSATPPPATFRDHHGQRSSPWLPLVLGLVVGLVMMRFGWFWALLAPIGALLAWSLVKPKHNSVQLDQDGLRIVTSGQTERIAWREVDDVRVETSGARTSLRIDDAEGVRRVSLGAIDDPMHLQQVVEFWLHRDDAERDA